MSPSTSAVVGEPLDEKALRLEIRSARKRCDKETVRELLAELEERFAPEPVSCTSCHREMSLDFWVPDWRRATWVCRRCGPVEAGR